MTTLRLPVFQRPSRNEGLSLVELMVALVLGLLILTALITVFVNSSAARREIENTGRQIENGRYAGEILADDLRLAGFYGEINLLSATPAIAVPGSLPDPCSTTVADWASALYVHVQGYRAPDTTSTPDVAGSTTCDSLVPSSNLKAGSDVLVVRRVRTCAAGTTGCDVVAGGGYLQVSLCATETPVTSYKLGADGTETFDRTQKNCATAAVRRQYYVNVYFVAPCSVGSGTNGVCASGDDSIPTLKRLELGNVGSSTPISIVPLVEGVEEFKIEYGIDNTGDGLPDVYTANPSEYPDAASCDDACKVTNWGNVLTARVYVLARNLDTSPGYTDTKTYTLGSASFGPFNDGYRRHVYTTVVRMMNPAGKRDAP